MHAIGVVLFPEIAQFPHEIDRAPDDRAIVILAADCADQSLEIGNFLPTFHTSSRLMAVASADDFATSSRLMLCATEDISQPVRLRERVATQ